MTSDVLRTFSVESLFFQPSYLPAPPSCAERADVEKVVELAVFGGETANTEPQPRDVPYRCTCTGNTAADKNDTNT